MISLGEARQRISALTSLIDDGSQRLGHAESLIERAHCYEIINDDELALRDYFSALDVATERRLIAHIRAMIALNLLKKGRKEEASWWAHSAVEVTPESAEAYHAVGLCFAFGELHYLAGEAFRKTLEFDPTYSGTKLELGKSLRESYRQDEAIVVLTEYVADHPSDPKGWFELGWSIHVSLHVNDRRSRALECYHKALSLNPHPSLRQRLDRKINDLT